jgi:hypothetical protein
MPSNNALNLADASRSGWCYGLTSRRSATGARRLARVFYGHSGRVSVE